MPHLDDEHRKKFNGALIADGWEPMPDDEARARDLDVPVLSHRWRHPQADVLVLVVLAWYPLVVTIGPVRRTSKKIRRAVARIAEVATTAGGRELADKDLDRVVQAGRSRWEQALEARRVIEEQRKWLECRRCRTCSEWSDYSVLHCKGCSRRFAPADDSERDEQGKAAEELTRNAEWTLLNLGRGVGLWPHWPTPLEGAESGPPGSSTGSSPGSSLGDTEVPR